MLKEKLKLNFSFKQSIRQLSQGEKQRAAFIIQILKNHDLLILDEPTSALDELNAGRIFELISQHDKTCLVFSHDLRWQHLFDETISFSEIKNNG